MIPHAIDVMTLFRALAVFIVYLLFYGDRRNNPSIRYTITFIHFGVLKVIGFYPIPLIPLPQGRGNY